MIRQNRQSRLQLKRKPPRVRKSFVKRLFGALALIVLIYLVIVYLPVIWAKIKPVSKEVAQPDVVVVGADQVDDVVAVGLDKQQLAKMIGPRPFQPDEIHAFRITDADGHELFVRTTLDPYLQSWAVKLISNIKASSAALVVMDPHTGEVLAMASYRADGLPINQALISSFPAASLFKIVTAAAAVEKKNMTSDTTLAYDGGKWTLFKKNVDAGIHEGSHQVTLEESFADSINTVFGKIGAFSLGKNELESFARRFLFNQDIQFEMPVEKSRFSAPEEKDPYRLAELASGFNRTTKLSPLHGAMLASAIVNNGRLMEPTIVKEVFDMDNRIYYEHKPATMGEVVQPETVRELKKFMQATIQEGTGRRRFKDADYHRVLSNLDIGGKSGTINNDQGNKVDWFLCFAKKKQTDQVIALSAVVVHGAKLGTRSQEIVREAIIRYYDR